MFEKIKKFLYLNRSTNVEKQFEFEKYVYSHGGYDELKKKVVAYSFELAMTDREIEIALAEEGYPKTRYNWVVEAITQEAFAEYICKSEIAYEFETE